MSIVHIYPEEFLTLRLNGITLKNKTLIVMFLNGEPIQNTRELADAGVICWAQLKKASKGSGRFSIFICPCGNPGCGGADDIIVKHTKTEVEWWFDGQASTYPFLQFGRKEFVEQAQVCEDLLSRVNFPLAFQ